MFPFPCFKVKSSFEKHIMEGDISRRQFILSGKFETGFSNESLTLYQLNGNTRQGVVENQMAFVKLSWASVTSVVSAVASVMPFWKKSI